MTTIQKFIIISNYYRGYANGYKEIIHYLYKNDKINELKKDKLVKIYNNSNSNSSPNNVNWILLTNLLYKIIFK